MDELTLRRLTRRSEEAEELERKLLELAALQKLYRQANGRNAATAEALACWVQKTLGDTEIDPYEVLDRGEIAQLWEDVDDSTKAFV